MSSPQNQKRKTISSSSEDSCSTKFMKMEMQMQPLQKLVEELTREKKEAKGDLQKQVEELTRGIKLEPVRVRRMDQVLEVLHSNGTLEFKRLLPELTEKYRHLMKQLENEYRKRVWFAQLEMGKFFYTLKDKDKDNKVEVGDEVVGGVIPEPIAEYCQTQVKGDEEAFSFWEEKVEEEKGDQMAPLELLTNQELEALVLKTLEAWYQEKLKKLKVEYVEHVSQARAERGKLFWDMYPKYRAQYILSLAKRGGGGEGTREEASGEKAQKPE